MIMENVKFHILLSANWRFRKAECNSSLNGVVPVWVWRSENQEHQSTGLSLSAREDTCPSLSVGQRQQFLFPLLSSALDKAHSLTLGEALLSLTAHMLSHPETHTNIWTSHDPVRLTLKINHLTHTVIVDLWTKNQFFFLSVPKFLYFVTYVFLT